jgi:hypothetical protein
LAKIVSGVGSRSRPLLLTRFPSRWFKKRLIRVASAAVPWVLRGVRGPHPQQPPAQTQKGQVNGPRSPAGERRDGIPPINKAKQTCPARCAIAALLPSPNGNESACLPAASSPADHFISHHSPPGRQHQIPTLLNPLVAVSILSSPDNHSHYFPTTRRPDRRRPEPISSIHLSSPPPPPVDDLMELQFYGLLW